MTETALSNPQKVKGRSIFWRQRLIGYAFLAPTIIFFLIFTVTPLVLSFYYAFTDYNLTYVSQTVGFQNFTDAFKNSDFTRTFLNVTVYAVMVIPLSIATSLMAAVLISKKVKGVKVFRVLYYIPAVTAGVAVAYMWEWMFKEERGLFNAVLTKLGLPASKWINSHSYLTMFCVALVAAWSSLGGNMLIFLAALKGISPELYEAADVDGASGFRKLISITLPAIAPTMYFIVTMSIINAFQLFDLVYIMIPEGVPRLYANTPVVMIYEQGFNQFEGGYGTAMSMMLFVVIMVVTFVTQRLMKEDKTI